VEDDLDDLLLVQLALQKTLSGVPLAVVSDGVQAVEYLKGAGPYADRSVYPFPDIVLLDLKLPLMNGFEVIRWIRQQPELKLLPVIAVTGSLRNEDAKLACDAGANVCVFKSEGFKGLAEMVLQVGGATLSEFRSAKPVASPQQGPTSPRPEESGDDSISEPPDTTTIQPPPDGDHPASGDRPSAQK